VAAAGVNIVADSPAGSRILFVECKTTRKSTPEDATRVRRNLITHSELPADAIFLLATPSMLFLWNKDPGVDAVPSYTADARPLFRDYLGKIVDQQGGPRGESLELSISSWLGDLVSNLRSPNKSEADRMLAESGLLDKIKRGSVRTDQHS
jgi:hypothetical protein